MGWHFALVDPATNASLGAIPDCEARKPSFPFGGPDTATFTVDGANRFADRLLECKDFLFVYDGRGVLMMNGPIISAEESIGDEHTIAVTAQSPWWWLGKRLIGKTPAGHTYTDTDRSTMIQHMVDNPALDAGNTFLHSGNVTPSGMGTAGPWHYKPISEAILEISSTLDGPDWWLTYRGPGEVDSQNRPYMADMQIAPVRGIDRSASVFFEYGCGRRNLKNARRPVTRDGLLSQAYGLPPGFPQTTDPVTTFLDATQEGVYGAAEGVVPEGLINAAMRQELLREHVRVRKQPRQVITFEPYREDTPRFGVDYNVGDVVTGRAVVNGKVRFNATFRIYMVTFDIDDLGIATPSIQVVPG